MTTTPATTTARLYTCEYILSTTYRHTLTVSVVAASVEAAIDVVTGCYDALAVLEVHSEGVRLY